MNYPFTDILQLSAPGPIELLVILIIAIIIFGKRLPEIGRSLGKSVVEFKKGIKEAQEIKGNITNEVKKVENEIINPPDNSITSENKIIENG